MRIEFLHIHKKHQQMKMKYVGPCALPIHPTTNWWRMRGHKSFIEFDHIPSPLVLERIVKSLTFPPSQGSSNDLNLWSGSDTTCQIVCLTDPSNNQLMKDEGAQIFYSIQSQTKPIGIGVNCEIPHGLWMFGSGTQTISHGSADANTRRKLCKSTTGVTSVQCLQYIEPVTIMTRVWK